jgi:protein SCO1/2
VSVRPAWGLIALIGAAVLTGVPVQAIAGTAGLAMIGPAPPFTLTSQDNGRVSLIQLQGKVVAVTFIYTSCQDTCPILITKLAGLQARLGPDFGRRVSFVAITVDPARDRPDVLSRYALAHGVDLKGWAFLTGTPVQIRKVAREYGVYVRTPLRGGVDHTFLTSLVDQRGILRVQYLGTRFDPDELLGDIRALLREGPTQ